jgi:hypothetical protein
MLYEFIFYFLVRVGASGEAAYGQEALICAAVCGYAAYIYMVNVTVFYA